MINVIILNVFILTDVFCPWWLTVSVGSDWAFIDLWSSSRLHFYMSQILNDIFIWIFRDSEYFNWF